MFLIAAVPVVCALVLMFLDSRFGIGSDNGSQHEGQGPRAKDSIE